MTEKRLVRLLGLVFGLSGFAALLYQVAWQRLLTLHYGVGATSIILIVSVYMLGLGFGALIGGFLAERVAAPLRLYALVELAIAAFGMVSLPFLDFLGRRTAGASLAVALPCVFLFLCVPTLLMGTTLPVVTRIFNGAVGNFLASVSALYCVNTLGAALGALLGGFVLISFFGLDGTVSAAAAVNLVLAALIAAAGRAARGQARDAPPGARPPARGLGRAAYALVFVTGFLAIGYEIIWFRLNEVLTKNSAYSFAAVLFVYLLGIGLGSLALGLGRSRLASFDPRNLCFALQAGIGLYVLGSMTLYALLTEHTPLEALTRLSFRTHPHPSLASLAAPASAADVLRGIYGSLDIFLWPAAFLLVPTVLMGAAFPLVSHLACTPQRGEGGTVGTVYCFNILGNVLGGIVTGFALLPALGTERTLLGFGSAGVLFAGLVGSVRGRRLPPAARLAGVAALLAAAALVFPGPGRIYAAMHASAGNGDGALFEEGLDGVVVTFHRGVAVRHYINGLPHGSRPMAESYFEIGEAALFTEDIRDVLVIGYGAGTYVEALLRLPELEALTLVELSETSIRNLRKMRVFDEMLRHPRLELVIDDGRRFLLRTSRRFDLVALDPLHPHSAYSNNIYSREFFELVRSRLSPRGSLLVFSGNNAIVANTVLSVFDRARVYRSWCIASSAPFSRDERQRAAVLAGLAPQEQRRIGSSHGVYLGDEAAMRPALAGAGVNRDWKPAAEYFLGAAAGGRWVLDPRPPAAAAAAPQVASAEVPAAGSELD